MRKRTHFFPIYYQVVLSYFHYSYTIVHALKSVGHYKYQALLLEILNRYLLCASDEIQRRAILHLFDLFPKASQNDTKSVQEMMELLYNCDANHMEKVIYCEFIVMNLFPSKEDLFLPEHPIVPQQVQFVVQQFCGEDVRSAFDCGGWIGGGCTSSRG